MTPNLLNWLMISAQFMKTNKRIERYIYVDLKTTYLLNYDTIFNKRNEGKGS